MLQAGSAGYSDFWFQVRANPKLLRAIKNPVKARVIVTDDDELQVVDVVQTDQQCNLYWIDLA